MSNTLENVVNAANEIDPNAPIVQAAEAVVKTIEDPSPANLLNDVELAIGLVKQLKTVLSTSHPSVTSLVKKLLFS